MPCHDDNVISFVWNYKEVAQHIPTEWTLPFLKIWTTGSGASSVGSYQQDDRTEKQRQEHFFFADKRKGLLLP